VTLAQENDRLIRLNCELKKNIATNLHDLAEAYNTIDELIEALHRVSQRFLGFKAHWNRDDENAFKKAYDILGGLNLMVRLEKHGRNKRY